MSQYPQQSYQMNTLHSPPQSPQQGSGPEYIPMNDYPSNHVSYAPSPVSPIPQQATIQPQYTHPTSFPSPGLPPPGTEPPYTSAPNSPGFPTAPYNQKPNGFPHPQQPARLHTTQPYNSIHDSTPKSPVYTPGGMTGPNGPGIHAPGQIGHPNQQHGMEKYKHGFCDCFGDIGACCTGCWCPCILYSRTKHRIKTIPNSNLNAFSACNPHCIGFCVLSPISWVFTLLQRTRIRENYRLEGSVAGDCARAYCCVLCTLVQDEREVREREDERRRFAGPGSGVVGDLGYKRPDAMVYSK